MSTPTADIILEPFEVVSCNKCQQPCDVQGYAPFDHYTCPVCGAEWVIPARFANFIVLEQLGKGGMGAVYRAFDETLNRTVALKVMQQQIGQDRAFVDQFLQEARALAAINSPNIVQIYSYGEENGQPYIVMELVDGDRLDHIHAKRHALDEKFVLETAIQVCRGMQAANDAGMTHGDIKPANILFDAKGHAKVSDFGLARLKGERPRPGEIWGTPYYVSPEVVRGQAPNAASDIYSLGGTLYHILTGEPPFNGQTVNDTVLLRFKEPAPDPRTFKPGVSAPTAAILLRMLEADPGLRYPNYASLLIDLQRALDALNEAANPNKKKTEASKVAGILVGGLIALAVLGIIGYVVFKYSQKKEREAVAQAQFEKDRLEGKIVQKIINGRVQWVPAPSRRADPASSAAAQKHPANPHNPGMPGPAAIAAGQTSFRLSAAVDYDVGRTAKAIPNRTPDALFLRGGADNLENSALVYLQFPLADVPTAATTNAILHLTFGLKPANNRANLPHKVALWALNIDANLAPGASWTAQPATLENVGTGLDPARATSLLNQRIPANPTPGTTLELSSPELAHFIASYPGRRLTLVLVACGETEQRGGWRFASGEASSRSVFPPPTLEIQTAP